MKKIPLNLKGKLFCSSMPYSIFDVHNNIISLFLRNKINIIVNLAEREEYLRRSSEDLKEVYKENNFEEINFPIQDFNVPTQDIIDLIKTIISNLTSGKNVVIHCFAGLGRTGVVASIVSGTILKLSGGESINYINTTLKNKYILTKEQKKFILSHLDNSANFSDIILLSEYNSSSISS